MTFVILLQKLGRYMRIIHFWLIFFLFSGVTGIGFYGKGIFLLPLYLGLFLSGLSFALKYYFPKRPAAKIISGIIFASVLALSSVLPGMEFSLALFFFQFESLYLLSILGLFMLMPAALNLPFYPWILSAFESLLAFYTARLIRRDESLNLEHFKALDELRERNIKLLKSRERLIAEQNFYAENEKLKERKRIAEEIHDNSGHMITAAILKLSVLEMKAEGSEIKEELGKTIDVLNRAMNNIRENVHELYNASLSLKSAVEEIKKDYSFCPVHSVLLIENNPDAKLYYTMLAVIREALSNTARHSNADRIDLRITEYSGHFRLLISDNGRIDQSSQDQLRPSSSEISASGGIGLYNIEERVRMLGGSVYFSKTGSGFTVFADFPPGNKPDEERIQRETDNN